MKFDLFSAFQDFLAAQRDNLLLWVPIFLGIGAACYFGLIREPSFQATGAALAASLICCIASLRLYHKKSESLPVIIAMVGAGCLVCVTIGFTAAQFKTHHVKTPMLFRESRPVMVEATLDHRENQEGKKGTLLFLSDVKIDKWAQTKTPTRIRLTIKAQTDAAAGDRIKVLAKLTPLSPPVAPDAYDFGRHYYFEEIGALGYALSSVEIVQRAAPTRLNLENLRTDISGRIAAIVPERQAGIVAALMTGERAAIFDEDWDALRASGLAHIISISGLHVAMVAAPVFFLVRFLLALFPFIALRFPIKKIAAGSALLVCCLYVGLVVPSVPTTRALLMTGIALIAIILDRSPFSLRLVAFSAILVLLVAPESIWSVSFQMSFAAVTALVALAEEMRPRLIRIYADAGWIRRSGLFIAGILTTSLAASLATAPYSLYHFQQIASYSVLANALSVPISGLMIMPMVIISFILLPFGLADWSLKIMGMGVDWLLDIARWTQNLPGSVLTTQAMPEYAMVMITISGLILILFHGRGRIMAALPFTLAIIACLITPVPDILVSNAGTVIAVRGQDHIYLSSARRDKFAIETWLKRWNKTQDDVIAFPRQGTITTDNGTTISCDPAACRVTSGVVKLSFGARNYELQQDCNWADIIISEARLPRNFCGDRPVSMAGYYEFSRNGALAITTGHTAHHIESVGEQRGYRPWSLRD